MIYNNRKNFCNIIEQFRQTLDDEDTNSLLTAIVTKLNSLRSQDKPDMSPLRKKSGRELTIRSPEKIKEKM